MKRAHCYSNTYFHILIAAKNHMFFQWPLVHIHHALSLEPVIVHNVSVNRYYVHMFFECSSHREINALINRLKRITHYWYYKICMYQGFTPMWPGWEHGYFVHSYNSIDQALADEFTLDIEPILN